MLHPKTDEHLNPSVVVHHLVGKLSTAETLLTDLQRKVVCNQGTILCLPYIFVKGWNCFGDVNFTCIRRDWISSIYTVISKILFASFPITSLCAVERKHRNNKQPVNYYVYLQYYCHPTLNFGCNRKYNSVFLFCSFQFNASEIVIDYTRDAGNKCFTGRRRLRVVELFTHYKASITNRDCSCVY